MFELSLLVTTNQPYLRIIRSNGLQVAQTTLEGVRTIILLLMIALYINRQHYVFESKPNETEALVEHGQLVHADYRTTEGNSPRRLEKKEADAQTPGMLEYFSGFRILFPYIW